MAIEDERASPRLILGPLLRYVGESEATVWVETDRPCEVEVLGYREPTFRVEGHHYALVRVEGLEPGESYEYGVALDGEVRWPGADSPFPPSVIRTVDPQGELEIVFGSCRIAIPHRPPYTLSKDEDDRGREWDALYALAQRLRDLPHGEWPDLLLMLGDQVYVDEGSPRAREQIRRTRDTRVAPGEEVANFEEYTWLYHEAWGHPVIRWLLSVLPSVMVIDDHDMHDDWKISRSWLDEMRATPWWAERCRGGLVSYWVYQHIGNLAPHRLAEDEQYRAARELEDAGPMLREFVEWVDRDGEGKVWSIKRDFGRARILVVDDRTGRVLEEGRRSIFDDHEWEWIVRQVAGEFDHLLIATTDPFLLAPGMHYLEAWSEAVCDGAWGRGAARVGERLRRALDLDHWGAFRFSFNRLAGLLEEVGAGRRFPPPATVGVLSGDVHHAYLADVAFPARAGVKSVVYQAVCSPFRNALDWHERLAIEVGLSRTGQAVARTLARAAAVSDPPVRWRVSGGPFFDNQVATLRLAGRNASLSVAKPVPDDGESGTPRLERVLEHRLA